MKRFLPAALARELLCRWYRLRRPVRRHPSDLAPHLDAAADWIARAQDAGSDDGVCAYYAPRQRQWAASYPETTGYIIPTFYAYAHRTQRSEFHDRASRMAHWECDVQLADGAVRAGFMDADPVVPTVFNTGQVLFGWARAYQETKEPRFAESLARAANWLVAAQDDDGAWRRHGSPFASHALNAYNTRSALGLVEAGRALDESRYIDAARANARWALTQMRDNGWLENNDLEDNRRPLTHTLGYALHGLVEIGRLLDDPAFVDAARPGLSALADRQRRDGSLAGRFDAGWQGVASWTCLTGDVQLADGWLSLSRVDDGRDWRSSAASSIGFVASTQDLAAVDPARRGAVAGSWPTFGGYMTDRYPNWAAKFFMDAVMHLDTVN